MSGISARLFTGAEQQQLIDAFRKEQEAKSHIPPEERRRLMEMAARKSARERMEREFAVVGVPRPQETILQMQRQIELTDEDVARLELARGHAPAASSTAPAPVSSPPDLSADFAQLRRELNSLKEEVRVLRERVGLLENRD